MASQFKKLLEWLLFVFFPPPKKACYPSPLSLHSCCIVPRLAHQPPRERWRPGMTSMDWQYLGNICQTKHSSNTTLPQRDVSSECITLSSLRLFIISAASEMSYNDIVPQKQRKLRLCKLFLRRGAPHPPGGMGGCPAQSAPGTSQQLCPSSPVSPLRLLFG